MEDRTKRYLSIKGKRTADSFHRELGKIMWDYCGMGRNEQGLKKALELIPVLREEFWKDLLVPGSDRELNQSLELAGRVGDFLEFAEMMCHDALTRTESCGAHFREESQTEEGEAKRDDKNFSFVSCWEFTETGKPPTLHKEPLVFESVEPGERSYK